MLTIRDKSIQEKIKQLRKAIEIVGGKELLENLETDGDIASYILYFAFTENNPSFDILDQKYTVNELFKIKLDYEKNYIKNKKIYIEKITYKIKEYNTYLDTLIRKYRKNGGIEEFRNIKKEIELRYSKDINTLLLSKIKGAASEEVSFYGDYLNSKKEDFINSIICNIV